jgi:hypothetical protein
MLKDKLTNSKRNRSTGGNTGLAKVAVQCSADTFVVKIATFAKRQTVMPNAMTTFKTDIVKSAVDCPLTTSDWTLTQTQKLVLRCNFCRADNPSLTFKNFGLTDITTLTITI